MPPNLAKGIKAMLKDYARCIYFESKGNPARALRVAGGLIRARIKHDIGPFHYSLFRFADIPKTEWNSYIRNKQFYVRITRGTPDNLRQFVDNKVLFYQYCLEHDLPTPAVTCIIGKPSHPLSGGAITRIEDIDQWKSAMESAPRELFVKPIDGAHGIGTFIIRRSGHHFTFGYPETEGSLEDLYRYVLDSLKTETALLVQPRLRPHPKILEISSVNALATVRLVTAMVNNKATVLYACVRLPVGTNINDNFSAGGASGNLAVAIDIDTGTLSEGWCSARSDWPVMRSTDVHPDTGHQIRGAVLPLWPKIVDLALRAQNSLPQLRTVGWDIAVTDDGVTLIEANDTYGVESLQVAYQRGLGIELISVIEKNTNPQPAQL